MEQNERINQDQACSIIPVDAKELIKEYLKPSQRSIRIKNLRELILEVTGKHIGYHIFRKFVQKELRYKTVSPKG